MMLVRAALLNTTTNATNEIIVFQKTKGHRAKAIMLVLSTTQNASQATQVPDHVQFGTPFLEKTAFRSQHKHSKLHCQGYHHLALTNNRHKLLRIFCLS